MTHLYNRFSSLITASLSYNRFSSLQNHKNAQLKRRKFKLRISTLYDTSEALNADYASATPVVTTAINSLSRIPASKKRKGDNFINKMYPQGRHSYS